MKPRALYSLLLSIVSVVWSRPDFDNFLPSIEDKSVPGAAYRHRSAYIHGTPPHLKQPRARGEGWSGPQSMKKIVIAPLDWVQAQGLSLRSAPRGLDVVHIPSSLAVVPQPTGETGTPKNESKLAVRAIASMPTTTLAPKEVQPVLRATKDTEEVVEEVKEEAVPSSPAPFVPEFAGSDQWAAPARSTVAPPPAPPTDDELNKETKELLSGWLEEEREITHKERKLRKPHKKRRKRPANEGVKTTKVLHAVVRQQRRSRKPKFDEKEDKPQQARVSTVSGEAIAGKSYGEPVSVPSSGSFVEQLGSTIEEEESKLMQSRKELKSRGINPLMYRVVNGILYDRSGLPVKRMAPGELLRRGFLAPAVSVDPNESSTFDLVENFPAKFSIVRKPTPRRPQMAVLPTTTPEPQTTSTMSQSTLTLVSLLNSNRREHEWKTSPPPFPFKNCYMNNDGFMCCNSTLEAVMRASYESLPCHAHGCPLQHIVKRMRQDTERSFGVEFEIVSSYGDFAMHAHFSGDLTCKIERGGRFIAAYATATAIAPPNPSGREPQVTDMLMLPRDRGAEGRLHLREGGSIASERITTEATTITPTTEAELSTELKDFQRGLEDLFPTSASDALLGEFSSDAESFKQLDAPSIDLSKPDESFKLALPFHERSRG